MTDVLLAVPDDDARRLVASADHHGHRVVAVCRDAADLAAAVAGATAGDRPLPLAVVAARPGLFDATALAACDRAGVRVLAFAPDAVEQRHARALGLLDVVHGAPDWTALDDTRPDLATPPRPPEPPRRAGRVIAVWGPHGAPGRTSIAIALAAELADLGRAVVLVDADSHAASVAPALGLLDESPGFAAACRLAGSGALTADELDRVAQGHGARQGGFRVLTGLGRPSRWPELTPQRIEATLAALRGWADAIVVDVAASLEHDEEFTSDLAAPRRNAATTAVLGAADEVVAVAAADPVGIARFLRAHVDLLEVTDPSRVRVVVNRLRSGAVGMSPGAQVRQTLLRFGGIDDVTLVPHDLAAFDAAIAGARPLGEAAPRSAARLELRRLAERMLPQPASEPAEAAAAPASAAAPRRLLRRRALPRRRLA